MTSDPAVRAAAEALASHYGDTGYAALHEDDASVAVAAARPLIEAEVRERIAAEIEARVNVVRDKKAANGYRDAELDGLRDAARIARGGAS